MSALYTHQRGESKVLKSSKGMRREFTTAVILVVISIIMIVLIYDQVGKVSVGRPGFLIVVTPRSFPLFAAGLMLGISTINFVSILKKWKSTKESDDGFEKIDFKSSMPVFFALFFYVLLLELLGYIISTILLTVFLLYHFGARKWQVITIGLFLPPIIFYIFKMLYVPLPKGFLGL